MRLSFLVVGLVAGLCLSATGLAAVIIADSATEYSSTQGKNNWYYGYYDGDPGSPYSTGDFEQMTHFNTWPGWNVDYGGSPGYWTCVGREECHPNGPITSDGRWPDEHWAVRRWVSEISGTVLISGHVADGNSGGGDGVIVRIIVDGVQVWSQTLANGNEAGFDYQVPVDVTEGSLVDFAVSPGENDWWDMTWFTATIEADFPVPAYSATGSIITVLVLIILCCGALARQSGHIV